MKDLVPENIKENALLSFLFEESSQLLFLVNKSFQTIFTNKQVVSLPFVNLDLSENQTVCQSIRCVDVNYNSASNGCTECVINKLLSATYETKRSIKDIPSTTTVILGNSFISWSYELSAIYLESEDLVLLQFNDKGNLSNNVEEVTRRYNSLIGFIEGSSDSIWSLDSNCNLVVFNSNMQIKFERFYGVHFSIGENFIYKLPPHIRETWRLRVERAMNGERFSAVDNLIYLDNQQYIDFSFAPIYQNEYVVGVSCLAKDITGLRRSEFEIKKNVAIALSQIENSHDFMWSIDLNFNVVLINSLMKQSFNLIFGTELVQGMNSLQFLPDELNAVWRERYERSMNGEHFTIIDHFKHQNVPEYFRITFTPILIDHQIVGVSCVATDITSQKRSELEIRQQEASLKALIENTQDSIWSIDQKFTLVNTNNVFKESFKLAYNHNLEVGDMILAFIPKELRSNWQQRYTQALMGERFSVLDVFQFGSVSLYYETSFNPIRVEERVVGVSCYSRDVTQLYLQAANLTAILESTSDVIWSVDSAFHVTFSNTNFSQFSSTFFTKRASDFDSPNGLVPQEWVNLYRRALRGEHFTVVESIESADHDFIYYQISFNPIEVKSEIVGVVCFAHDITPLKRNEASLFLSQSKLNEAQEVAKIGSWDMNYETNKGSWSDELYEILGLPSDSTNSTLDTLFQIIGDKNEQSEFKKGYAEHLIHKKPFEVNCTIITSNSVEKHVVIRCKSEFNTESAIVSSVGTIQDVTEQRHIEIALKEAVEMKTNLFSLIAHDLRSPFNTLLGFMQLLTSAAEERDYEGTLQYSGIIQSSAESVFSLLNNLLDWSNSQLGRNTFYPELVDVNRIIKEVHELVRNTMEKKEITFVIDSPSELHLRCDKNMMSTIIRNLISNAIKFSYSNGSIILKVVLKENLYLFSVSDQGVGMDADQIALALNNRPYSSDGTHHEKGTGLGLLLCKDFILRHGGDIWVESQKGKGSTFYVTIPILAE